MLHYSDNKPMGASPVRVYRCPRCSHVVRIDDTVLISNSCPRCREADRMRFVRAGGVAEIEAHVGVPAAEWEDLT